ncbi:MAG: hypothetical protein KatS3mg111_2637 [Pirellulaceae bacterium]|nr:MAG: hypothetical protein KatS3mg111_2637 [Pirellulaceae bacterium]
MTEKVEYGKWVEVNFDCLPLRCVSRLDIPLDASPKLAERMLRIKRAIDTHGTLNSYYLHHADCTFHFTNNPNLGMVQFAFEGVVLTDEQDVRARNCELEISLHRETCSWLNQAIVDWLEDSVKYAVLTEFDRFIQAGDLTKAIERIRQIEREAEESGGFMGMYL